MDGKGRCLDNVFVERLWRSLKYEEVYLHAYDSLSEARKQIDGYFVFYNESRTHQALGNQTPKEFYETDLRARAATRTEPEGLITPSSMPSTREAPQGCPRLRLGDCVALDPLPASMAE